MKTNLSEAERVAIAVLDRAMGLGFIYRDGEPRSLVATANGLVAKAEHQRAAVAPESEPFTTRTDLEVLFETLATVDLSAATELGLLAQARSDTDRVLRSHYASAATRWFGSVPTNGPDLDEYIDGLMAAVIAAGKNRGLNLKDEDVRNTLTQVATAERAVGDYLGL